MTSDELLAALEDAVEGMADMIGYVPEYFREKWEHDAYLERGRDAIAKAQSGREG